MALDLVRADGTTLAVLVKAVERRDEAGRIRFVLITVFNATDRRRYERELLEARRAAETANAQLLDLNSTLEPRVAEAVKARLKSEDALRQAQKMEAVGQLAGGIAHDFNNMLAVILASINLLEKRLTKREDVAPFVAAARDGVDRAAALIQRLLAFSRRQDLAPEPLDVNEMVRTMCKLLRRTLGGVVQLETASGEDLGHVLADANGLGSAVLNLAINARDAMPAGGRLSIATANCEVDDTCAARDAMDPGPYVLISVTDTGTGMPPGVIAKAFDPFFTTKEVGKGTGLGLSQVFGFVKRSPGHVRICSAIGHGTTVKLYLPRLCRDAGGPRRKNECQLAPPLGRERILLVEDDEQVLFLTRKMLTDLGYDILPARDGAEALEKAGR